MKAKLLGAAMLSLATLATAAAQTYPSRPVKILLPYSAGSAPDVVARVVANHLSKDWNNPVIVENRVGANGVLAMNDLKGASPDGYTLIVLDSSHLSINPSLYPKLSYNVDRDLAPLTLWADTPFYLITAANGPFKSVQALIAQAKQNPGRISYGSPTGIGNPAHLGMELFKAATNTDMLLVPYKTSQPMMSDLKSGTLGVAWASLGSARALLQSGDVVALAVGSKHRQPGMPNVPTLAEAGGPSDLEVGAKMSLFGPAGMPADVTVKLVTDVNKVLAMPDVQKQILAMGYEPLQGGADQIRALIAQESKKYGDTIRRLHLTSQ